MNLPTKITFARIIAIVIMIVTLFILSVIPGWHTIALGNTGINLVFLIIFIFFVLASYTDYLDGHLARKNNQVTDLGKFLDPVADKLLVNSMVIFLIVPASYAPGQMSWSLWCAILLVARDIIVDALRFIAAQKGVVIAANIFGKAKTVLEMIAVSLVLLNSWPFSYFDSSWPYYARISMIFVYIATAMSIISGIIYVKQNFHVLKEKNND